MKKKYIFIIAIIILLCSAIGYKINSDNEVIKNSLLTESKNFIVEAKKMRIIMIEGGDDPYHKDMNTDYLAITDNRIDTKDKLFSMMQGYFTREYVETMYNQLYFEKNGKLCLRIVGDVRINDFTTAYISSINITPITKNATLELYVYSSIHNEVNRVIFKLKPVDGEYKIDENIGGW
jgi:hypothetical protein